MVLNRIRAICSSGASLHWKRAANMLLFGGLKKFFSLYLVIFLLLSYKCRIFNDLQLVVDYRIIMLDIRLFGIIGAVIYNRYFPFITFGIIANFYDIGRNLALRLEGF